MNPQVPQLIASDVCLNCPVCCRFPEKQSPLSPFFFPEERAEIEHLQLPSNFFRDSSSETKAALTTCQHGYQCSFFHHADHTCQIYHARPLDCSIYPVVVMWNPNQTGILIGLDTKCPEIQSEKESTRIPAYLDWIQNYLEQPLKSQLIASHLSFVAPFQEEVILTRPLSIQKGN